MDTNLTNDMTNETQAWRVTAADENGDWADPHHSLGEYAYRTFESREEAQTVANDLESDDEYGYVYTVEEI